MAFLPGRAGNQDRTAGNLAILDHLQDNSSSLSGLFLANEALRRGSGLETGGIDAQAANVRVSGDEVETAKVLGFGDGH